MNAFLFYNSATGGGAVGEIIGGGEFKTTHSYPEGAFATGWEIVKPSLRIDAFRTTGVAFFYNPSTGAAATGTVINGEFVTESTKPAGYLGSSWTHILPRTPRTMLFYRASTGEGSIVQDDVTVEVYPPGSFAKGWTHIVPIRRGPDLALFYNAKTGAGAITQWHYKPGSSVPSIRTIKSYPEGLFSAGTPYPNPSIPTRELWSTVTSFDGDKILFYNRLTGAGAIGQVKNEGFVLLEKLSFRGGWSHIAGFAQEDLLFYDTRDGSAAVGFNPTSKVYDAGAFRTGWTQIIPLLSEVHQPH
jgi:hypothetical protein